jgi:hypothetical protein
MLLLIALVASGLYGQTVSPKPATELMGHKVILVEPKRETNDLAGEPYQVCFDATTPAWRCYTPQDSFYRGWGPEPGLVPVDLGHGRSALLFSVYATASGSGANIHIALLRPSGREAENLLPGDVSLKEISGHKFLTEPAVSESPILITADFVWELGENHPDNHRYIISAYVLNPDTDHYYLDDRYMTTRKYEGDFGFDKAEVFVGEKPEIIARLKRAKAEREHQPHSAR